MCMDYISLAWLDSIPHVRALLQATIALYERGVATQVWSYTLWHIVASVNV